MASPAKALKTRRAPAPAGGKQALLEYATTIVVLRGTTDGLITNHFSPKAEDSLTTKDENKTKAKRLPRDPQQEFEAAIFRISPEEAAKLKSVDSLKFSGGAINAAAIKRAMLEAATIVDFKRTVLESSIQIIDTVGGLIPIYGRPPVMRKDMVILRYAGRQSARMVYRPLYQPWAMKVTIEHNRAFVSAEQMHALLFVTGKSIGLGSWRLKNNGSFGGFKVESMDTKVIEVGFGSER